MNRNKIQALKKITFALLMTTTLSDQAMAQTEDDNKEKSTYVHRVRKKEADITADIDSLKAQLISREKELAMLKATREAKKAAMIAAEASAKSIIGDQKKAHNMALSLVKHKKFHKKSTQDTEKVRTVYGRKTMLRGLAKNAATQAATRAATRAATQKAYEILKDNDQALEVVKSLKIGEVTKKTNPKGESIVRIKPSSKRIVTMQDIKNSSEKDKKELVNSKIIKPSVKTQSVDKTKEEDKHKSTPDKAKTALEIGAKTIDIGLKIGKAISELIVH